MTKAVFLDMDGTITRNTDDNMKSIIAKAFSFGSTAIKLLKKNGFKAIIVTNQAKIGLGIASEKRVREKISRLKKELLKKGAIVDAFYYCPHHPEAKIKKYKKKCDCRKPKIGMLKKAGKKFKIDFSKSYVIGDDSRDIAMGKKAGCKTILVMTGHAGKDGHCNEKPDFTAKNLFEATKIIAKEKD